MSRIFWDTNLFIYLYEDYGDLTVLTGAVLRKMNERGDELLTSALTVGEVLTGPTQKGDLPRCTQYENAIRSSASIVSFDLAAARSFAAIRGQHGGKIKSPDAIQLACAATARVDLFLTNDTHLHGVRVDGIHFITSVDRAPL